MKAIIHVGDMKCGSKSIQVFAKANQRLLHDSGILVSSATRCGAYHSLLASYALDDKRLDSNPRREWGVTDGTQLADHRAEAERRIAGELSAVDPGIDTILFSHERLLSLDTQEVNRLMTLLRKYFSAFRIVAYLRRQDWHLVSLWGQHLTSGRVPPKRFYELYREKGSYLKMLDNWDRAVGREGLSVRRFEPRAFDSGCLHRDFCTAAGIPWEPKYVRPKPANVGINRVAQAFLQSWNASVKAENGAAARPPRALIRFLQRHFAGEGMTPPRVWAKKVMRYFAPENEEIRRRYLPESPVLFDDDFRSYPGNASTECTVSEAFRVAMVMWQHLQQGSSEEMIQQAYGLVLGRAAAQEEIVEHTRRGCVRGLYVDLLQSEEYSRLKKWTAAETNGDAA